MISLIFDFACGLHARVVLDWRIFLDRPQWFLHINTTCAAMCWPLLCIDLSRHSLLLTMICQDTHSYWWWLDSKDMQGWDWWVWRSEVNLAWMFEDWHSICVNTYYCMFVLFWLGEDWHLIYIYIIYYQLVPFCHVRFKPAEISGSTISPSWQIGMPLKETFCLHPGHLLLGTDLLLLSPAPHQRHQVHLWGRFSPPCLHSLEAQSLEAQSLEAQRDNS